MANPRINKIEHYKITQIEAEGFADLHYSIHKTPFENRKITHRGLDVILSHNGETPTAKVIGRTKLSEDFAS